MTDLPGIEEKVHKRKWIWTDHIIRKNTTTWTRQSKDWYSREDVRKRGYPPKDRDKEMKIC